MQINSQTSLLVDQAGTSAYVRADVAEQCVLLKYKEICSFGSGTWYDGTNARDVMENSQNWIKMIMGFDSLLVVEKKKVPNHLAGVPVLDKVTTLREALLCFEDAGEACSLAQCNCLPVCLPFYCLALLAGEGWPQPPHCRPCKWHHRE